ncbi:MAG: hypothetical protein ACRC9R_05720 [Enterovibrio sp.]
MRADPKRSFELVRGVRMQGFSLVSAVIGMTLMSLVLVMAHLTLQPMLADFGKIPRQVQALTLADTIINTLHERLFLADCQKKQIDLAALTGCYANSAEACAETQKYQGSIGQFLKAGSDLYAPFSAIITARKENFARGVNAPKITSQRIDVTVKQAGVANIELSTYWSGAVCDAVLYQ